MHLFLIFLNDCEIFINNQLNHIAETRLNQLNQILSNTQFEEFYLCSSNLDHITKLVEHISKLSNYDENRFRFFPIIGDNCSEQLFHLKELIDESGIRVDQFHVLTSDYAQPRLNMTFFFFFRHTIINWYLTQTQREWYNYYFYRERNKRSIYQQNKLAQTI